MDNRGKLKIHFSALCAMLFALCVPVNAQQSPKIPRVGVLFMGGKDQPHLEALKKGFRDLGYREGKNIVLIYRYAEGRNARLQDLAKEFVRDEVDVIVTTSTISAQAARQATQSIPIVMTSGSPIQQGLADSLAKPGGNVTGLTAKRRQRYFSLIDRKTAEIGRRQRRSIAGHPEGFDQFGNTLRSRCRSIRNIREKDERRCENGANDSPDHFCEMSGFTHRFPLSSLATLRMGSLGKTSSTFPGHLPRTTPFWSIRKKYR